MERPGEKLKQVREKLRLTYRDVEKASQQIARRHGNDEYVIALSRLADIEHKGTVPTIYRLYALCAIYRLDVCAVLEWYGVPVDSIAADIAHTPLAASHLVNVQPHSSVPAPLPADAAFDPSLTTLLQHAVRRWGKVGLGLLNGLDLRHHRYAFIGMDDWSMYPVLHPGSLLLIDERRRKIVSSGWINELDRPIYFLELRTGYRCGWCSATTAGLIYQPHPGSQQPPELLTASDVYVVGQVTGVAMRLEVKRPPGRTVTVATGSRDH